MNGICQTHETVCFVCSGTVLQDEVYERVDDHCSPRDSHTTVWVLLRNGLHVNAIILRVRYFHPENCCLFCWKQTNFSFCKRCSMGLVQPAQSKVKQRGWIVWVRFPTSTGYFLHLYDHTDSGAYPVCYPRNKILPPEAELHRLETNQSITSNNRP